MGEKWLFAFKKKKTSNYLIITIIFNVFGDFFPFLENENGSQLYF